MRTRLPLMNRAEPRAALVAVAALAVALVTALEAVVAAADGDGCAMAPSSVHSPKTRLRGHGARKLCREPPAVLPPDDPFAAESGGRGASGARVRMVRGRLVIAALALLAKPHRSRVGSADPSRRPGKDQQQWAAVAAEASG